jgi:hypothetical protein
MASAANLSVVTVRNFENEKSTPQRATLDVLQRALEAAGVEFTMANSPASASPRPLHHTPRNPPARQIRRLPRKRPAAEPRKRPRGNNSFLPSAPVEDGPGAVASPPRDRAEVAEEGSSLTAANDLAIRRALEAAGVEFSRHRAISSLRASATIIVLRV